jgi:glycosyltransferase 2 family protein
MSDSSGKPSSQPGATDETTSGPAASAAAAPVASPRRRILRTAIRLLGPIVLVLLIWRLGDPEKIWELIGSADLSLIALAVLINFANIHLKVLRWRALLAARGIHYPLGRAWGAFLSSLYVGMLTPGRVGDVLRIQYLRHDQDTPYAEGLASVVMDRLCDLYVLGFMVAAAVARFSSAVSGDLATVTWVGVGVVVIAPLVLLIPGLAERTMGIVYARVAKDPTGLSRFLDALRGYVGRGLLVAVPLSVIAILLTFVQGWLVARAVGLSLGYLDVAALLAIGNFLGLLPISISGVGVREAFYAVIFPSLGLAATSGVGFGLLVFVVIYVGLTLTGFVSWQLVPPPTGSPPTGPPPTGPPPTGPPPTGPPPTGPPPTGPPPSSEPPPPA